MTYPLCKVPGVRKNATLFLNWGMDEFPRTWIYLKYNLQNETMILPDPWRGRTITSWWETNTLPPSCGQFTFASSVYLAKWYNVLQSWSDSSTTQVSGNGRPQTTCDIAEKSTKANVTKLNCELGPITSSPYRDWIFSCDVRFELFPTARTISR